ncbi:hypothetical protein CLOSTMETH_03028 [[Clostridium] methylpentosum DSM 5476]|uniref:Uncharacterized protein n=1 Tax=[Clostridium] methylpentosum DSM 5476 TaxID=537013 RepID=C0EGN5_9FIRM|nr:hypothetical protein CLOSTMETH_03028 [[Clostridium] methylpentosum DSM 5476]
MNSLAQSLSFRGYPHGTANIISRLHQSTIKRYYLICNLIFF